MSHKVEHFNVGDKLETLVIVEIVKTKHEYIAYCNQCKNAQSFSYHRLKNCKKGSLVGSVCYICNSNNKVLRIIETFKKEWYEKYKGHAKDKGRDFELTQKEFIYLCECICFYCGNMPDERNAQDAASSKVYLNGVDRIDNTKGYTYENVAPCCSKCNMMKRSYSMHDFFNHIHDIYWHQNNKDIPWDTDF